MKILIAEDDFVSRRLMQGILSPYGECHVAVNGREAVEQFKLALKENDNYDLVCLDIMMPEKDGNEVLREIRDLEDKAGILGLDGVKIIMTTALDNPRIIMKAFKDQCEDYIIKPVDKTKLLDKVRKLGLIK